MTICYQGQDGTADAPNSNFIGITTLHVMGRISAHHQEFLAVYRLWYILCSCVDRLLSGAGWNAAEGYVFGLQDAAASCKPDT